MVKDPPALLVAAVTTSEGIDRAALLELYTKHALWTGTSRGKSTDLQGSGRISLLNKGESDGQEKRTTKWKGFMGVV